MKTVQYCMQKKSIRGCQVTQRKGKVILCYHGTKCQQRRTDTNRCSKKAQVTPKPYLAALIKTPKLNKTTISSGQVSCQRAWSKDEIGDPP